MAQRVSDIEDMRVRLTSILLGVKNVDLTQLWRIILLLIA